MGYLAPGKMFDNMLQLMRFRVYFEGVLNSNNGYFHIKIMISEAHMLGGSWAHSLREILFIRLLCGAPLRSVSSHTKLGVPQISFFAHYMRPPDNFFVFHFFMR